jgi:hypothetical protein
MSDKPLPRPVSSTDFYLAAILGELKKQAQAQPADDTGLIDLREPAPPQYTPLPDDFPGRDALLAAGIDALEDVPRTGKDLTAVSGIGKVTANQILTYFKVGK